MSPSRISTFAQPIAHLPERAWQREDLLIDDLLLEQENDLSLYYAPYDYVNPSARVTIVGITPGFTQMSLSLRQAKDDLASGISLADIDRRAKYVASFAGTMRRHLVDMLNELGLPELLNVTDSSELFDTHREFIHTTSVIRYPLFRKGDNYTGHQPRMLSSGLIRKYALNDFASELAAVQDSVIIPLGKSVSDVLRYIDDEQPLPGERLHKRCLFDFPHPSGANGHRKKQFELLKDQHREILRHKLNNS
ncbi:uracil-DNA glycosylase family protein [Paenibacillus paeoniae]|uniref:Uracil-DNA glycosylase-like domain-containing protein n=1 Tax=Paenibacillus paeoniae TaxID=2292705 RepID=A0A371P8D8_9BACL|nr:hypothetical protein [Paenibacillus paeoniae]REK71780.1 hypothetical protein DX130_18840 [Paenibacillus paeoniae]